MVVGGEKIEIFKLNREKKKTSYKMVEVKICYRSHLLDAGALSCPILKTDSLTHECLFWSGELLLAY